MKQICEKSSCCGCGACAQICPKQCIQMKEDEEGFLHPSIDENNCVNCMLCKKVCPELNVKVDTNKTPKAFAAYHIDDEIRKQSSSGGIFTLFAQTILERGGIVFGAAMSDDNCSVRHIEIENEQDLTKLRGSKYIQSEIKNCYKKAKQYLENDKYVLFSGAPCQIEGLKSFLNKDYDKLFCVDFICHGVPSPKVWKKYLKYKEKQNNSSVSYVSFRNKKYGWYNYHLSFKFNNQNTFEERYNKNIFMKLFLQDLCLRKSCYDCSFKKMNRVSDVTLADFWGCDTICPDLNDNKGLSLVILHTEKAEKFFSDFKDKVCAREVSVSESIKYNLSMIKSVSCPPKRDEMMQNIDRYSVEELAKKYVKKPTLQSRIATMIPKPIKNTLLRIKKNIS